MKRALPKNVQAELDKLEPAIRDAFLAAIADIKNTVQLGVVTGHIENGRIDLAIQALRLDDAFFDPVGRLIGEAFIAGGRVAQAGMPKVPDPFPAAGSSSASTAGGPARNSGWRRNPPG